MPDQALTWDDISSPPETETAAAPKGPTAPPARSQNAEDPWAQVASPAEDSFGHKASVVGRAASGAAMEAAGAIPGAIMGGKIGASIGAPFFPPFGPAIGGVIGAIGGGIAGSMAGSEARSMVAGVAPGVVSAGPETESPEDRPLSYAGEAFGGSLAFGAGFYSLARMGMTVGSGTMVQRMFSDMLSATRAHPWVFASGETAAAASSAVGAAMAEKFAPGEPLVRVPAEIAMGFASPGRILSSASDVAVGGVRKAVGFVSNRLPDQLAQRLTPGSMSAQQMQAAKVLQDYLSEEGVDAAALRDLLTADDIAKLPLSAGQKTGDPALLALEAELSRLDERFRRNLRDGGSEAIETVKNLILMLRGTGQPEFLKAAAQARQDMLEAGLTSHLENARQQAVTSAAGISTDAKATLEALSVNSIEAVGRVLKDGRAVERSLWDAVPQDLTVSDSSIREAFEFLDRDRLVGESFELPKVIRDFVTGNLDDLGEEVASGEVTVGTLLKFRRSLLSEIRKAAAGSSPDKEAVRQMEIMSDAILRALNDPEVPTEISDPVDAARAFSRALNDVYTRSFAGSFLRKSRDGGYSRAPEAMYRFALATGGDATNASMRDIDNAMQFVARRYEVVAARQGGEVPIRSEGEVATDIALVADAQERALRIAAAEAIDPTTGLPSEARLKNFQKNYAATLERFPQVSETINKALKDREYFMRMTGRVKQADKLARRKSTLYKITGAENPADAIRSVINGGYPQTHLRQLARSARDLGPEGEDALIAAVFDFAIQKGTNLRTGERDLAAIRTALAEPLRPNQPALIDILKKERLGKPEMYPLLDQLFARVDDITASMRTGDVATVGSAASRVMGGGSGASLIAASRGSATARNIFQKLPEGRVRQFLADALRDPEKLAALLETPVSQADRLRLNKQLHGYILQTALPGGEQEEPAQ
jgi:hypothetical protein